ncbi:hypothetical protein O5D80_008685 [Batrachochytrium dendrobatidis]|nr:hypothetical protein O5D80_008685 [Batrachochytrium dendrobatidis]
MSNEDSGSQQSNDIQHDEDGYVASSTADFAIDASNLIDGVGTESEEFDQVANQQDSNEYDDGMYSQSTAPLKSNNVSGSQHIQGIVYTGSSENIRTPEYNPSNDLVHDQLDVDDTDQKKGGYNDESDNNDDAADSITDILGSMLKPTIDGRPSFDAEVKTALDSKAKTALNAGDVITTYKSPNNMLDEIDAADIKGEDIIFQDIQKTLILLTGVESDGGSAAQTNPTSQDQIVARLKVEYDKLHRLFFSSRKNEKTLVKKCRELITELSVNASKVQVALKLSQNDRSTIAALRKEVKKAWKMVETAGEKESRAKDAVSSLKNEVESLRMSMIDQGLTSAAAIPSASGLARNKLVELQIEQEDQLRKITKEKQAVEEDLINANADLRALKIENEKIIDMVSQMTSEKTLMDNEMLTLKDLLASKKAEQDRDTRSRGKIELALKQSTDAWEKRENEIKIKTGETKGLRDHMIKLDMQLQNERIRLEKSEKDREQLSIRMVRVQQEYDEKSLLTQRLLNENHEMGRDLKLWEEELSRLKDNFKMVSRVKETLSKKLKITDEAKLTAEMDRDSLRSTNSHLTHDIEGLHKEFDQTKKILEMTSRERDIAQKNFVKATGATQKQFNVLKLAEQTQRKLEQEIQGYKDEAQKMRKLIYTLEKDRDNKINESSHLDQVIAANDEDMKMKDMIIFDSKKKIIEFERKLKEQQALYESVRADRNVYSKNLIESQDEITEMKRKLKIMNHQVEQLKEEIASKESILVKEHFEHSKLEKEKDALSIQIGKLQQQYEESQQMIQNQQAEENKLRHIITEADTERLRQKKEYETVVQERDILGTQLIRRNDELSLLYEKIKIQTSTLNKGEIQYRERLEDIRVLRLEIKRLRREKAILQTETQNVDSLRNEIFRLQRDVLRERTRVKVLEEELESPMNIHRWRKLAGSDPSTYELITKIQTLQKRLISKTEEVVEKELIIQQKMKLYSQVKLVLQRQSGPEVVEELRVVREAVKTKINECKALASELNMYHSQVNEYKYEIDRLGREQQELKKKYYQLRKRHQGNKHNGFDALKDQALLRAGMPNAVHCNELPYTPGAIESMYTNQHQIQLRKSGYDDNRGQGEILKVSDALRGLAPDRLSIRSNKQHGPRFSGGGFNMSTGVQPPANIMDDSHQAESEIEGADNGKKRYSYKQSSASQQSAIHPTNSNETQSKPANTDGLSSQTDTHRDTYQINADDLDKPLDNRHGKLKDEAHLPLLPESATFDKMTSDPKEHTTAEDTKVTITI